MNCSISQEIFDNKPLNKLLFMAQVQKCCRSPIIIESKEDLKQNPESLSCIYKHDYLRRYLPAIDSFILPDNQMSCAYGIGFELTAD